VASLMQPLVTDPLFISPHIEYTNWLPMVNSMTVTVRHIIGALCRAAAIPLPLHMLHTVNRHKTQYIWVGVVST
jgi:hypothetical protein